MENTGCKVICGAPTTLAVKGLMMMMMMLMMNEFSGVVLSCFTPFRQTSLPEVLPS